MIENLTVENYRSFKNYSLNGLKRVNLLTGYNNSGKSSLLEAVEILAAAGDPHRLLRISERRNEHLVIIDERTKQSLGDLNQFFHNRNIDNGIRLCAGEWQVQIEYHPPEKTDEEGFRVTRIGKIFDAESLEIPYGSDGTFGSWNSRSRGGARSHDEAFCSVEYLGLREINDASLSFLWDRVLLSKSEREHIETLQILDPDIESVVYLSSEGRKGRIHLGKKGEMTRSPIGSHGEGMQRLLALSIYLATVKGGILLVDEIDTGLHYSVLADMWKLVIATAIKNDIQVFATTHSLDCLRGLNEACERNPEFANEISLQTIDRNLPQSIDTDAEGLAASLSMGIEVR